MFLLLLLPVALVAGCSDATAPGDTSAGTVTARVDGAAWESTQANATYAKRTLNIMANGRGGSAEPVQLDLNVVAVDSLGNATYQLGGLSGNSGHFARGDGDSYYTSLLSPFEPAGEVTITHIDSRTVSGTFSFTAHVNAGGASEDSVKITAGSFNVMLTR